MPGSRSPLPDLAAAALVFRRLAYQDEAREHGSIPEVRSYLLEMSRDTFENWQSEFLQLLEVVGLAYFLYLGSPSSKENDDRSRREPTPCADQRRPCAEDIIRRSTTNTPAHTATPNRTRTPRRTLRKPARTCRTSACARVRRPPALQFRRPMLAFGALVGFVDAVLMFGSSVFRAGCRRGPKPCPPPPLPAEAIELAEQR